MDTTKPDPRRHQPTDERRHAPTGSGAEDGTTWWWSGGGAAGLGGALTLARARRSVLVIDAGEPRNAPADPVHNYLGREGTPPARAARRSAAGRWRGYGGEVVAGRVTAVRPPATTVPSGWSRPRRAAGARPGGCSSPPASWTSCPTWPGLADRWGRDVLHCPYCHGWEVRDEPIAILATGPLLDAPGAALAAVDRRPRPSSSTPEPPPEGDDAEQLAALGHPGGAGPGRWAVDVVDDHLDRPATGRRRLGALPARGGRNPASPPGPTCWRSSASRSRTRSWAAT